MRNQVFAEHVASSGKRCARRPRSQHQEFPVNARGPPSGILGYHFEDEFADLFAHRPPPDLFTHAGDQPPIHLKTRTVPAHHGIGRHYDERRFPRRPETMKEDPEQLVGGGKPRAAGLSLEHGYLLTRGEILNQHALTRAEQPKENTNPKPPTPEHDSNS